MLLSDLILNAIHFLKPFQIRRSLNQHHFLDLSRMKILETGNLLAVADARLNHRLLAGFIISLFGNFFLKQFRCGHLLSNAG